VVCFLLKLSYFPVIFSSDFSKPDAVSLYLVIITDFPFHGGVLSPFEPFLALESTVSFGKKCYNSLFLVLRTWVDYLQTS